MTDEQQYLTLLREHELLKEAADMLRKELDALRNVCEMVLPYIETMKGSGHTFTVAIYDALGRVSP